MRFKVIWLHSNNGNCVSAEKTQKKTHWTFGRIASATVSLIMSLLMAVEWSGHMIKIVMIHLCLSAETLSLTGIIVNL